MIVNGGSYRNARWWANHLRAKENDSTRVVESYGLRADDIPDMLREMEAFAQGTRCDNFMYQMNLNPLDHERLNEQQWTRAREIAEKHHGFEGQAYFVVEHVKNGRTHQHIVWSRIDLENMRAISDSKDARRNHAIARSIERELGLEPVKGPYDREPGEPRPKRAPEPWEMYRGMKTGLDPRDIAAEVTELFQQSRNGREFQGKLEQHRYILVQGDRRGFLILDSAGKEHSLARRIDGVKTKELNAFMHDVDREFLPTVAEGKAQYQERKIAGLEADRATVEREIAWEEALAKGAIEKEKIEKRFVEPGRGEGSPAPVTETRSPFEPPVPLAPPHPQLNRTAPELWFEDVAGEIAEPKPTPEAPENLKGARVHIWNAWHRSDTAPAFAAALEEQGILLAAVSHDESYKSHREAEFAKAVGNYAVRYGENEIVAVASNGFVYKLNERNTGEKPENIEKFLAKLDRASLQDIAATRQEVQARADQLEFEGQAFRDLSSVGLLKREPWLGRPQVGNEPSAAPLLSVGAQAVDAVADVIGGALEMFGDMFGATPMTPERLQAALDAKAERAEQQEINLTTQGEDDRLRGIHEREERERKEAEERYRKRDGLEM